MRKRNICAVLLLVLLAAGLYGAGHSMQEQAQRTAYTLQGAYALARAGQTKAAAAAYEKAAAAAAKHMQWWGLFMRRDLLDTLAQTLALLPGYTQDGALQDLRAETTRACTQLAQLQRSFFGGL